jgi:Type IV secretion-system coupling protein DNA-binding domain
MKFHKLKRIAILTAPLMLCAGAALAATSGWGVDAPLTSAGDMLQTSGGYLAGITAIGGAGVGLAIRCDWHDALYGGICGLAAVTLISSPSTKVILRVDETEMAEWASQQLGSREVQRLQMAQLAGVSSYREGINLQPQRTVERIVLADEIKLLPPLSGFICIAGHDRSRIKIDKRHLVARQPALIARTYGSDTPRAPAAITKNTQGEWSTI